MIEHIGSQFYKGNIESGEYSYIKEAGSRKALKTALGRDFKHYRLDIRFEYEDVVVLIETKQNFIDDDTLQLADYIDEEKALHPGKKIIAILANTENDRIKVWKSKIDDSNELKEEVVLEKMEHYVKLFELTLQNDRETVLKNTLALNELLHKNEIREDLRSQFVGTLMLYLKKLIKNSGVSVIDENLKEKLHASWDFLSNSDIRDAIGNTLEGLLDGSDNKTKKVELLKNNVLQSQDVKALEKQNWLEILDTVLLNIYRYINADSSEGQDILNLFFIAFNKYTGKANKNQAFTPDHITEFMCRLTNIDRTKRVFDGTCGSGSFLVQALVKEMADCRRGNTDDRTKELIDDVKHNHIFGVELDEKIFGLATTNMLIHGDGNSNIKPANLFDCETFIREANPDVILMNPPYNATTKNIPEKYKSSWTAKQKTAKEEPTKGFVFLQFLSDIVKKMNEERLKKGESTKEVKLAVLLPVSAAIGTKAQIQEAKKFMLENNRLEAVFTLPEEIFYPGAAVIACCMVFTLGHPHQNGDGTIDKTFFGYYKDDGFKKKKNLGRIEQFDNEGSSKWKEIENKWLSLFRNKSVVDGLSATSIVTAEKEWLCEAYMKTDYSTLSQDDFQQSLNNYLSYLIKGGKVYES